MATPGGEHLQASSSSSSSTTTSSFTSGYSSSTSTIRSSRATTTTEPACLTMGVLQESTDNFSEERVLGQGTYGKVYKGILENGEEIAVKMLHNNMQAIDDEKFKQEFDNLMMLDHKNTVRLVAYCYETRRQHMEFKGERVFGETTYKALCFEYMHMGSLQRHLSDETQGLDWQTRYRIIKGTCEGLKYLHEGFKEPIYHLDLKPDNILLDKNMVPKLADFGMSKLFREEQTRVTQSPIGTIGYLPPEYLFGQVVSKKLDIFSLGVIITKIIAGPSGQTRSVEMPSHEFLYQVNENWRNRLEATCTPQTLEANCMQVSMCTEIGLRCMDMDRKQRPSIVDIIHKLDITETILEKGGKINSIISKTQRGVDEDYQTNQQSNPRNRRSSLFAARLLPLAETELAPTIIPSASPIRKPGKLDLPSQKSTKLLNGDLFVNKDGLRIVTQSEEYQRPGVGRTDVRSWAPGRWEVLPDPQPLILFGLLSIDDLDTIKVIGKGSSGVVHLVRHKRTSQFFALKVMQLNIRETIHKQMAQELKISMSTQCQYVVTCYHCFYVNGIVSIALEYMDCGSLDEFLKTVRTIPEAYLAAICKQVLKGLLYLHHEKHIIHRDLKPSNILINHRGEIKISDFGVCASIASSSAQRDTFTGTFCYMAPERISGQKHGCPSDIWSLGLVMLECATGSFPYPIGDSFYDLLEAVVDQAPPSALSDRHSPEFCSFISACIQKDATDRSSAQILLAHPFLSMYDAGLDVDLADYLRTAGSPLVTFQR